MVACGDFGRDYGGENGSQQRPLLDPGVRVGKVLEEGAPVRLANWPCGIREAHGAARERAEQRDSGARWKKEGGGRGTDGWGRSVSGGAGDALAGAGRRAGRAGPRRGLLAREGKGRSGNGLGRQGGCGPRGFGAVGLWFSLWAGLGFLGLGFGLSSPFSFSILFSYF